MRRLAVVELVVLAAALAALAAGILAASLLLLWCCRRATANRQQPTSDVAPQLPPAVDVASELPVQSSKKPARRRSGSALRRALLRLLLCSRRRLTRVEPADSAAATQGEEGEQATGPEEEVATWRDRWFGPTTSAASRALYTIDEESGGGSDSDSESEQEPEPETPFYTPPASPPRLGSGGHSTPPEPEATV